MAKSQKRLGELLIEKGRITQQQLSNALAEQSRTKEFLGAILLKNKQITEKDLLEALSEQFDIPVVSLKNKYIDWNLVKIFSPSLILDYRCFPVDKDSRSVTFAIANPLDVWVLKKAEEEARGLALKLVLASRGDIDEAVQRYRQYMIKENISGRFR